MATGVAATSEKRTSDEKKGPFYGGSWSTNMRLVAFQVFWGRDGDDWVARKGRYQVRITRDERYPQMWRVHRPDGSITDMVNLARARDAALGMIESLDFVRTGG